MSPEFQAPEHHQVLYRKWLLGTFIFLAILVWARFILEVAGVSPTTTRYFSVSGAVFLAAIYLGVVGPLRGVRKSVQLILPSIVLAAWTQFSIILVTFISGVLRLEKSHFAEPSDYGNWARLGRHILEHAVGVVPSSIIILLLMATVFLLHHWPITVAPGALLGAMVVLRYWTESMDLAPTTASAWSSSVGFLLCGFYLGGLGPRQGLVSPKQLFVPALVLGWVWRFWIFLAAVMTVATPYYRTHFFDPTPGRVALRLAKFFAGEVLLVGLVAGLVAWGIAVWISRATRPALEAR